MQIDSTVSLDSKLSNWWEDNNDKWNSTMMNIITQHAEHIARSTLYEKQKVHCYTLLSLCRQSITAKLLLDDNLPQNLWTSVAHSGWSANFICFFCGMTGANGFPPSCPAALLLFCPCYQGSKKVNKYTKTFSTGLALVLVLTMMLFLS